MFRRHAARLARFWDHLKARQQFLSLSQQLDYYQGRKPSPRVPLKARLKGLLADLPSVAFYLRGHAIDQAAKAGLENADLLARHSVAPLADLDAIGPLSGRLQWGDASGPAIFAINKSDSGEVTGWVQPSFQPPATSEGRIAPIGTITTDMVTVEGTFIDQDAIVVDRPSAMSIVGAQRLLRTYHHSVASSVRYTFAGIQMPGLCETSYRYDIDEGGDRKYS